MTDQADKRAARARAERERRARRKAELRAASERGVAGAEPWVDILAVAAHLGVSDSTVTRLSDPSRANPMPSQKIGASRRWKISAVEAWIADGGSLDGDAK